MHPAELGRDLAPGHPGAAFGDADEQQGEPAQQHVGADTGLQAVVDGAEEQRRLQVPEAPLGLEEVLVAERHVLGAEFGIRGREQVLAVEALF